MLNEIENPVSSLSHLTDDQQIALKVLNSHKNAFITGGAGTGKSYVLSQYLKDSPEKIPILASTGAAAVLLGGRTFHSFFGLGLMDGGLEKTVQRALKNKNLIYKIRKTKTIVIDEISMLNTETLNTAEMISRLAKESMEPWGGMRVIFVGDFAQLPPVERNTSQERPWAFKSQAWISAEPKIVHLKEIVRCKDQEYNHILAHVRQGIITGEVKKYLDTSVRLDSELPDNSPRIFARKNITDEYNNFKLDQLRKPLHSISSIFTGKSQVVESLKKQSPLPEILLIKEGAYVMLRQNDPKGRWVNGSTGWVREIKPDRLMVELENGRVHKLDKTTFSLQDGEGEVVASITNFPITLAYATTIHKSQGQSLGSIVGDLRQLWEPGQAYVALSRLTSGKGLHLIGWNPQSIRIDTQVLRFYQSLESH